VNAINDLIAQLTKMQLGDTCGSSTSTESSANGSPASY